VLSELWHQRPGPRTGGPRITGTTKEIVNGLDRREVMLGAGAGFIAIIGTVATYFADRHSSTSTVRAVASELLVAGLVVGVLMLVGVFFRRRALLGFSAFLVGMETITAGNVIGLLYLFFGGWLIFRVMQKQKRDRAAGLPTDTVDTKPDRRTKSGAPRPSKRYTPPRHAIARKR
jgi:hypothetical protein